MDFNDETKMRELVSIDPDLPAIPRWQMESIFFPDLADFLARKYGTKEEQKQMKALLKPRKDLNRWNCFALFR